MQSEVNKSTLANIQKLLKALEDAVGAGFNLPEIGAKIEELRHQSAELLGFGLNETDEEKKRKEEAQVLKMAVYQEEIRGKIDYGFDSKEDFFDFAKKFKDEDFRQQVEALSEGDKKKLADNAAKIYAQMTPEEQRKFREENPELIKFIEERNTRASLSSNAELEKMKAGANQVLGANGEQKIERMQVANSGVASTFDIQAQATTIREDKLPAVDNKILARASLEKAMRDNQPHEAGADTNANMMDAFFASSDVPANFSKDQKQAVLKATEVSAGARPSNPSFEIGG